MAPLRCDARGRGKVKALLDHGLKELEGLIWPNDGPNSLVQIAVPLIFFFWRVKSSIGACLVAWA
jgi:hypothetical protein